MIWKSVIKTLLDFLKTVKILSSMMVPPLLAANEIHFKKQYKSK